MKILTAHLRQVCFLLLHNGIFFNLVPYFIQNKINVHIFAFSKTIDSYKIVKHPLGFLLHLIPSSKTSLKLSRYSKATPLAKLIATIKLFKYIVKLHPDIVFNLNFADIPRLEILILFALITRSKVGIYETWFHKAFWYYKTIGKLSSRFISCAIVVEPQLAGILRMLGVNTKK